MTDAARSRAIRFRWNGIGPGGVSASGELMASSEVRARIELRQLGITPTRVGRARGLPARIPVKTVAFILRQLATLIKAGVPLLSAFDIMARSQEQPAVTRLLLQVRSDLQTGTSLAKALARHPDNFDALTCTLVAAGEQSGLLDVMLGRVADYLEKMLIIRGKIRGALTYPAAILVIAAAVTILMLLFVVPAFQQSFTSFGAALPLPTRMIISGSGFIRDYGLPLALGLAGLALWIKRQWPLQPNWQRRADHWLLKAPVLGSLLKRVALARWSRTLASLYAAGIPLLDALIPAGDATDNAVFKISTQTIHRQVRQGASLSQALIQQPSYSPLIIQMVCIGEESGALDEMLNKVADIYEREVDDTVSALSSLLEPLMMVLLGTIIGGLVIAMYLPIFQLGSVL